MKDAMEDKRRKPHNSRDSWWKCSEISELKDMLNAGCTRAEISEALGRSEAAISQRATILRRAGCVKSGRAGVAAPADSTDKGAFLTPEEILYLRIHQKERKENTARLIRLAQEFAQKRKDHEH